ncbi:MAG: hypothetical protein JNL70_18130 [Saprospiraceae bacterium]|nr:hypothetical protein [Saprospiraceae bacterium]
MNPYIRIILFLLIISQTLSAQQEQTLNFATDLWQSNLTNPALLPSGKKIHISLPSLYFNANSPLSIRDLIVKKSNGSRAIAPFYGQWLDKLQENNYYNGDVQMLTAAVSFPITDNLQVSGHHLISSSQNFMVPRDAASLLIRGNGQFVGTAAEFGTRIGADLRSEFGLALTYHDELFSLGARIKSQNGIAGIFSRGNKLRLVTDTSFYELRLTTDYDLMVFGFDNNNPIMGTLLNNGGVSADFGARINLGKLKLSASVLDAAGSIHWRKRGKTYSTSGDVEFRGFNSLDPENTSYQRLKDTIRFALNIKEQESARFVSDLPLRAYIGANYEVTENFRLGGLFYSESLNGETKYGAMANVTINYLKWLRVGATLGLRNEDKANLGIHAGLTLYNTAQLYFVTDNILVYGTPFSTQKFNGRIGCNLLLGKNPEEKLTKKIKSNKMTKRYGTMW